MTILCRGGEGADGVGKAVTNPHAMIVSPVSCDLAALFNNSSGSLHRLRISPPTGGEGGEGLGSFFQQIASCLIEICKPVATLLADASEAGQLARQIIPLRARARGVWFASPRLVSASSGVGSGKS